MSEPYNPIVVMEVLVAITSRLHHARISPFTEDDFDAWQTRLLAIVREMSVRLNKEDASMPVTVIEAGDRTYEDLLDEFTMHIKAGIPKWETLYL